MFWRRKPIKISIYSNVPKGIILIEDANVDEVKEVVEALKKWKKSKNKILLLSGKFKLIETDKIKRGN